MSAAPESRSEFASILTGVDAYYSAKVLEHGATHRGADWNSRESQELRFEQLLKVVEPDHPRFSLNDYGCGYGALYPYLRARYPGCSYRGYDLSGAMLEAARVAHREAGGTFIDDATLLGPADYTIASGVFNVRLTTPDATWLRFTLETIEDLARLSMRGFSFNMLTIHSDAHRMRPDLYYADPAFFFEHCRRRFSRRVALLHDYELYEFTVIVRLS